MAHDALVRDVEPLAIAVEQRPQRARVCVCLRVRVARVCGELGHQRAGSTAGCSGASSLWITGKTSSANNRVLFSASSYGMSPNCGTIVISENEHAFCAATMR